MSAPPAVRSARRGDGRGRSGRSSARRPTTPKRARRLADASVDPTESRNDFSALSILLASVAERRAASRPNVAPEMGLVAYLAAQK
jgi:hypothetical protein